MAGKKFYAVRAGRQTGLFTTWEDCKAQVQGYSGAVYKSFPTLQEAQQYLWGAGDGSSSGGGQKTLAAIPEDEMVAYVDGSYHNGTGEYAYGVVILYQGSTYELNGKDNNPALAEMRNVAGEIQGAQRAMAFALEQGANVVHIFHDYAGIAHWCTGEWQAKKPGTQQYRADYLKMKAQGLQVHFHKVRGHSGDRLNDRADALAKAALGIQ